MAIKINIEKPPVYGAVKGATAFAPTAAWTDKQRKAGVRRETPVGSLGIGTNRVGPPPPPRDELVKVITAPILEGSGDNSGGTAVGGGGVPGNVGAGSVNIPGGFSNSNRGGYTTSGTAGTYGRNSGSGGDWGFTPSGVRSSAYNSNGTWGNAASGNPNAGGVAANDPWGGLRSTSGSQNSGTGNRGFWGGLADSLGWGGGGGNSGGGSNKSSGWGGWGGWGGNGGGGGGYGQSPGSDPWR